MAKIKNKLKIVFGEHLSNTHVYLNGEEIPAFDVKVWVGQGDKHRTMVELKLTAGDVTLEGDYHLHDEQNIKEAKFAIDHAVKEGKEYAK